MTNLQEKIREYKEMKRLAEDAQANSVHRAGCVESVQRMQRVGALYATVCVIQSEDRPAPRSELA